MYPAHVEGAKRHVPENPYKYTEDQLNEKKSMLKRMAEEYPDVNPAWREWVYDLCVNTSESDLAAMRARIDASEQK